MAVVSFSIPKYCHHKASGRAYVKVKGQRHYLGRYGTPKSKEAYSRFVAELAVTPTAKPSPTAQPVAITVVELAAAYQDFAEEYYRKNGVTTYTAEHIRRVMLLASQLYGRKPAKDFGPLCLLAIQRQLAEKKLARRYVNDVVDKIRRCFKWGVSRELIPGSVYHALATVEGLHKGRTTAREPAPILPVEGSLVDATLPYLPPIVADMVKFQRLTGCRPGEVCQLRPMDLDRSGEVWQYRPASHKTEHHGRERVIFIGPKAQTLLLPYLLRAAESYCFSATESEQQRRELRHAARKTPMSCGNRPGTNRTSRPKRRPQDHFTKDAYNRAVQRACEQAFGMPKNLRSIPGKLSPRELERLANLSAKERQEAIEDAERERKRSQGLAAEWRAKNCWSPNQLRHAAGTEVRRLFGLEAAQVILGHAKADVTQVYAERDQALAVEVMKEIG